MFTGCVQAPALGQARVCKSLHGDLCHRLLAATCMGRMTRRGNSPLYNGYATGCKQQRVPDRCQGGEAALCTMDTPLVARSNLYRTDAREGKQPFVQWMCRRIQAAIIATHTHVRQGLQAAFNTVNMAQQLVLQIGLSRDIRLTLRKSCEPPPSRVQGAWDVFQLSIR
jgi:hypothetical protein